MPAQLSLPKQQMIGVGRLPGDELADQGPDHATDQEMTVRTLALIGQVVIFCNNQKRPLLAGAGLDAESVRLMKLVVREHTDAICRAALAANP